MVVTPRGTNENVVYNLFYLLCSTESKMSSLLAAAETQKPLLLNLFATCTVSKVKCHTKNKKEQLTGFREKMTTH